MSKMFGLPLLSVCIRDSRGEEQGWAALLHRQGLPDERCPAGHPGPDVRHLRRAAKRRLLRNAEASLSTLVISDEVIVA